MKHQILPIIVCALLASCGTRPLTTYKGTRVVTEVQYTKKGVRLKTKPVGTASPVPYGQFKVGDTIPSIFNQ